MGKCDIGIYGLGIMGQNLALNFERNGFAVSVFNRIEASEESVVDAFISNRCYGKKIILAGNVKDFINIIKPPRKIIVLVKAGTAVDEAIERLIPFLEADDIIIDGGNSHYRDTGRRLLQLDAIGLLFIGCGISGGGDGALKGPSMMPGGSLRAWEKIKPMFQKIAAKNEDGGTCCDWIGPEGSGHFVKMVHNGIEYALMQVLAESFDVMKQVLFMSIDEISYLLSEWYEGKLHSYLLGITINILKIMDKDGQPLIKYILDCAEQKGTGKDISISALELGVPVTAISESLNARFISCMINERRCVSKEFVMSGQFTGDKKELLKALHDAVYCSKFIVYAQGLSLIARASVEYNWNFDPVKIARIWKNGCIIQSNLLNDIVANQTKTGLDNILLQPYFIEVINRKQINWRYAIITAIQHGIPIPSISSTLAYFDSFRSEHLPANLIQAQRDYFGSHGFERIDAHRGVFFNLERGKKQ